MADFVFDDATLISGDLATITLAIGELEGLINAGVSSVTQDGQSVNFDVTAARKRLRELKEKKAILEGSKKRRPRVIGHRLNF